MKLQSIYPAPPSWKHLLWVLPLTLAVLAVKWWFEISAWDSIDFDRPSERWAIAMFHRGALEGFMISGLLAVIPILAANWSRTIWPRITLAVSILAVQVVSASIYLMSVG